MAQNVGLACGVVGCKGLTTTFGGLCPWHQRNGVPSDITTKTMRRNGGDTVPEPELEVSQCKIEGCENERVERMGMYGGLCASHRFKAKEARKQPAIVGAAPDPDDEEIRRLEKAAMADLERAATAPIGLKEFLETGEIPPRPGARSATVGPAGDEMITDEQAIRLANLIPLIRERREELLELQAEALNILTDLGEVVGA